MVVSRCLGIGPPSGISSLVCLSLRGVSVIPRAVSLSCFYKSIYRHLGSTPPCLYCLIPTRSWVRLPVPLHSRLQIVIWRLQDIVFLRGSCARINYLLVPPSPPALPTVVHYYCPTIAQYTTPLRPLLCMPCTMQCWSWQYCVKSKL